jgi:hypothetical protein
VESARGGRRPGVGQAGLDGPHRLGWLGQSKRPKPCWAGPGIRPKAILGCVEKKKKVFGF